MGGWKPPLGINLVLDGLSKFFLLVVNLIAFLVTIYSIDYMEIYTSKLRYYSLFLLLLAGMNGIILTGDIFNLFVFLEIAVISAYALVGFGTEAEELEASFKYLVLGTVSSTFILFGIAFLYSLTGSLNLADIGSKINASEAGVGIWFVFALFLFGFGLKAALMPFHAWLPDAHPSAPSPISAMLSGLVIKALGIYPLIRISYDVFGFSLLQMKFLPQVFMILSGISMAGGALLALVQDDIKRMLAYSSISNIGYILLAFSLGTPLGILAGLLHIFVHAVSKSLLFLVSGSIEYSLGTRDMREMGGVTERMPLTGFAGNIGFLSLAGIPPLAGFWSKMLIIYALIKSQRFGWTVFVIFVSVLTLGYYLRMDRYVFFGKIREKFGRIKESPGFMVVSLFILTLITAFFGVILLPHLRVAFLNPAAKSLIKGVTEYISMVMGG